MIDSEILQARRADLQDDSAFKLANAAGDRRDDADCVAFLHAGLIFLQVADIFVVHVDVYEAAEATVVREKVPS